MIVVFLDSNEQDLKSLKKLVTKALPLKDIWEYRKAAEYFTNAEQIIIDVLESAKKLSPLDELKLIFHMYDRLEKIFERVDDSGGYRFGVQYQISLALCSTISIQEWNTNQKAKWLIDALEYEYAYTGAIRTSIPALSGHPFRFNPDTDSGISQPVFC